MSKRATAPERFRRVLAMVPWIVANPGRTVAEVAERFELDESRLLAELDVLWMVGLPPYSPDALIEVTIEDGRVWLHYADFFSRPLRLTPAEALALVAASDALLGLAGSDPTGALSRGIDKLRTALGLSEAEAVDVHLGSVDEQVLSTVRAAVDDAVDLRLDYLSLGRDERTDRTVSPWRLFADGGAWYLLAWCGTAEGRRVFRLDRMASVQPAGPRRVAPPREIEVGLLETDADTPWVRLRLPRSARWVVETFPHREATTDDEGETTATFPVTTPAWLERLLLQLGPDVEVVAGSDGLGPDDGVAARAAERVLTRYGGAASR